MTMKEAREILQAQVSQRTKVNGERAEYGFTTEESERTIEALNIAIQAITYFERH